MNSHSHDHHPLMATPTSSIPLHVWFTRTLFLTTRVCLIYNVIAHVDILLLHIAKMSGSFNLGTMPAQIKLLRLTSKKKSKE